MKAADIIRRVIIGVTWLIFTAASLLASYRVYWMNVHLVGALWLMCGLSAPAVVAGSGSVPRADLERQGYVALPFTTNFFLQSVLSISINGTNLTCFLDTAADHCVLSPETARRIGVDAGDEQRQVQGASGEKISARFVSLTNLSVCGQSLRDVHAYIFSRYRQKGLEKFYADCALGQDFLQAHAAVVDYSARLLYLRLPAGADSAARAPLQLPGMTNLGLQKRGQLYDLPVEIDGRPAALNLDTGATRLYLNRAWARKAGLAETVASQVATGATFGDQKLASVPVKVLQLGSYQIRPNRIFVLDLADDYDAGILGNLELFRARAVIDCEHWALHVPAAPAK